MPLMTLINSLSDETRRRWKVPAFWRHAKTSSGVRRERTTPYPACADTD